MPNQERPTEAPDPATSYERAKPEKEAGMGRLDAPQSTPTDAPDRVEDAVSNEQESRQINAENEVDAAGNNPAGTARQQPDHSMHAEEPLGEDQAPADIHDPHAKRHPRKEGKGGVP